MKKGFDFISKEENFLDKLIEIENSLGFSFPKKFKEFISEYSFSSNSIVLEMKKDELRGFEFPAEAILFDKSKNDENPLYFNNFRDLADLQDDLQNLDTDELWVDKGLIVIGYSTVGEKICLGIKESYKEEIWRVNDDSVVENRFEYLAANIFDFIDGFVSKK
ncbi:MAG: SMI1/KNR4 family protein [Cytophagales bacterium]|nr:SMI1/KNR4 family protein [Cytophagales bacterium]